jgi:hypothetical protein
MNNMPEMCMQCKKSMMERHQKLESMYPKVYFIIYPKVKHHCDMMIAKHGMMYIPDRDEMKEMCEDIVKSIEHELHEMKEDDEREMTRQFGFARRRFLGDLAGILLINQLVGRPYYGYYPYSYYSYPYYGYYGYPYYREGQPYGEMYEQYEDYEDYEEE